jgi:hypothetical protein
MTITITIINTLTITITITITISISTIITINIERALASSKFGVHHVLGFLMDAKASKFISEIL